MGLFEEPLLHAIVRAYPDPDPARAFRHRPFVYGLARPDLEAALAAASRPASRRPGWLRADLPATLRHAVPALRPATEPACAPACC